MEIGRKESDEQLEERINAQAPNKCCTLIYTVSKKSICDALRDLVSFVQFKNVENTHGGVLIVVKLHAKTTLIWRCFFSQCCSSGALKDF